MSNLPDKPDNASVLEQVIIGGDLAKLTPAQRVQYYRDVCASLGLNPLTKPFAYITLNSKLTLYAQRDCTDQLRALKGISVKLVETRTTEGVCIVRAQATARDGRVDESTGAVSVGGLKGEALCNALMKAETKAKRRVTLSICGLGVMDETEISTVQAGDPDVPAPPEPRRVAQQLNTAAQTVIPPHEQPNFDWTTWGSAARSSIEGATDLAQMEGWVKAHQHVIDKLTNVKPGWAKRLEEIIRDRRAVLTPLGEDQNDVEVIDSQGEIKSFRTFDDAATHLTWLLVEQAGKPQLIEGLWESNLGWVDGAPADLRAALHKTYRDIGGGNAAG